MSQVQVQRRPWIYEDVDGQQVGGFVKEFDNIVFLTVKVNATFIILTDCVMSCFGGGVLFQVSCRVKCLASLIIGPLRFSTVSLLIKKKQTKMSRLV